jgi:hypothetical protein
MKSIIRLALLTAIVAVTALASAQKVRYNMRIDNLTGPQGFNVLSYSWGASNPVTFTAGGGLSSGKSEHIFRQYHEGFRCPLAELVPRMRNG